MRHLAQLDLVLQRRGAGRQVDVVLPRTAGRRGAAVADAPIDRDGRARGSRTSARQRHARHNQVGVSQLQNAAGFRDVVVLGRALVDVVVDVGLDVDVDACVGPIRQRDALGPLVGTACGHVAAVPEVIGRLDVLRIARARQDDPVIPAAAGGGAGVGDRPGDIDGYAGLCHGWHGNQIHRQVGHRREAYLRRGLAEGCIVGLPARLGDLAVDIRVHVQPVVAHRQALGHGHVDGLDVAAVAAHGARVREVSQVPRAATAGGGIAQPHAVVPRRGRGRGRADIGRPP